MEGLSDDEAGRRTTVSELCLGGLIKHVAQTEAEWVSFMPEGASGLPASNDEVAYRTRTDGFRMLAGDTVTSVMAGYDDVAQRTGEVVAGLPSLDVAHPPP